MSCWQSVLSKRKITHIFLRWSQFYWLHFSFSSCFSVKNPQVPRCMKVKLKAKLCSVKQYKILHLIAIRSYVFFKISNLSFHEQRLWRQYHDLGCAISYWLWEHCQHKGHRAQAENGISCWDSKSEKSGDSVETETLEKGTEYEQKLYIRC